MTFTTTYRTALAVPEPVQGSNPVTKNYLEVTVGTSLQDQLTEILNAVDVVITGDLVGVSTGTLAPSTVEEGNYTKIYVDQYGVVRSGTNLTFTSGNVQGSLSGATVNLNLQPTGVSTGTYGSTFTFPQITVGADGRITSAVNITPTIDNDFAIAGTASSGVFTFTNTLNFIGTPSQIQSVITDNTVRYQLTNNVTIPGIFTAAAVTAGSIQSLSGFAGDLLGNVTGNVTGNISGNLTLSNVTATNGTFTSVSIGGLASITTMSETVNTKTGAFGTTTYDFATGAIWYHTTCTSNITASLVNVPTTEGRALGITLLIQQGTNPFIVNAVTINNSDIGAIRWAYGQTPVGFANKLDMISFTLVRLNSAWVVTGSLTSFG
jgi:hypothetical protein